MYTVDDLRLPRFRLATPIPSRPCPFCHSNLLFSPYFTIASGCCYRCGRRVLDFPELISEPVHSFEEISQKCFDEHSLSRQIGCLIFWGYILLAFFAKNIAPFFGIPIGWMPQGLALIWPFLAIVMILILINNFLQSKHSYHCEFCHSVLSKQNVELLSLTGRCPNCAQRIVKDLGLPNEKTGSPRLEIDTYLKVFKTYRRRFLITYFWAMGTVLFLILLNASDMRFFMNIKAHLINQFGPVNGWIVIIFGQSLFLLLNLIPLAREYYRNPITSHGDNPQESGIACPCCQKVIYRPDISIATKRCHHCREIVFNEPIKCNGHLP